MGRTVLCPPELHPSPKQNTGHVSGFQFSKGQFLQIRFPLPPPPSPLRRDQSLAYAVHGIYSLARGWQPSLTTGEVALGHPGTLHTHFTPGSHGGAVFTGSSCTSQPRPPYPLHLCKRNPWRISHILQGSTSNSLRIKSGASDGLSLHLSPS